MALIDKDLLFYDLEGNNEQGSLELFSDRKNYKFFTFIPENNEPLPFDLWYDIPLYGRIDQIQNSVFPSETNLKQLKAEETIFALDFVVEAFEDLKDHMRLARVKRIINTSGTKLDTLSPQKSWESINQLHHDYVERFYNAFTSYLKNTPAVDRRVTTFKQYVREFVRFFIGLPQGAYFTRSSFILSPQCSPNISGLIIELQTENHSIDLIKQNDYLEEETFEFFRIAARKFGFKIDKNAPWRLIADITMPIMQEYMKNHGISIDNIFESYYYKAYDVDLSLLRTYMIHMYESYISIYPNIIGTDICNGSVKNKIRTKRENVLLEDESDDDFWLNVYFRIREKEGNRQYNEKEIKRHITKAIQLKKVIDISKALSYINERTKRIIK